MSIAEVREKCKAFIGKIPRDVLIIAVLILASSASFGFGYLAGIDAEKGSDTNSPPSLEKLRRMMRTLRRIKKRNEILSAVMCRSESNFRCK